MIRFNAHCAQNHDRVDFTDPQEFERHMKAEHGKRKLGGTPAANVKPYPWTAPKAPADELELARVLAANADQVADVDVSGAVPDGVWRWDGDTDVPPAALPKNLWPILEGAQARGEGWLVSVKGGTAELQTGRGRAFGQDGPTVGARVQLFGGKVRKVYTVDPTRPNAPTGWWESKITRVRQLFPAAGEEVPVLEPAA